MKTGIDCKSLPESKFRGIATFEVGSHTISTPGSADEGMVCKLYTYGAITTMEYMITNFGRTDGMSLPMPHNCDCQDYSASHR